MKNVFYTLIAALGIIAIGSCQKAPNPKPLYDNSKSFVSWTVSPVSIAWHGEDIAPPPFIIGWCYTQQYTAQRMTETENIGPFYGYPIGTFTPDGKLSFNYSNGNTCQQTMSLFINSGLKITGTGTYTAVACMNDGYAARIGMSGASKNLYLSGDDQIFMVDSYNTGYSIDGKVNVAILKGRFQLIVSDTYDGTNQYSISGNFQLPVSGNN